MRILGQGTSSVMIMNGTKDPINPFDGGEVTFLGLLKRGNVRSSRESGQYLADLNNLTGTPETSETRVPADFTSSGHSGATNPKLRWNSLPFTAADMAFLSHTGAIRDY